MSHSRVEISSGVSGDYKRKLSKEGKREERSAITARLVSQKRHSSFLALTAVRHIQFTRYKPGRLDIFKLCIYGRSSYNYFDRDGA